MPRKSKGKFYDIADVKALEGVRIPEKLKCNRCNKYKGHTGFSTKQLTDVRAAVKDKGQSATYNIKCMPCTGVQPVEIECTVCCVTKGLEAFAKSQRRRPDIAECFQCTEKRLDVAPYDEQQYVAENRSNAFSAHDESGFQPTIFDVSAPSDTSSDWDESALDDNTSGGVSLSANLERSLSISAESSRVDTLIGAEFDRGSQASQDRGWQVVERQSQQSWRTPSGHSRTATNSSSTSHSFNPSAYGRPSGPSVNETQRSFNSSVAERSEIPMTANGKFAKISAYIAPKQDWSSDEEEAEKESNSDDDSDDADDL